MKYTIIIVVSVLAAAAVSAAYGAQAQAGRGFDSDLPEFLKRTDSSLLRIVRDEGTPAAYLDEYSLASSEPFLYQFFSSVDGAYSKGSGDDGQAQMQVVLSRSQTRSLMNNIGLAPEEGTTEFNVYFTQVELGGKQYALTLMIPK